MTDIGELFQLYHASLVRMIYRRTGDRDRAEDLAQETFARAVEAPRPIRGRGCLRWRSTWYGKMAAHRAAGATASALRAESPTRAPAPTMNSTGANRVTRCGGHSPR